MVQSATAQPGGLATTYNALTKSNLENQYYGPTQMADIAAKNVYAQYLPAQMLGQMLSNPYVWQTMDKNVLNNLVKQYGQTLSNPPSIQSLSGMPNNGGGWASALWNKITGNSGANGAGSSNPLSPQGMPSAGGGVSGGGGNGYQQFGANNRSPNAEIGQIADQGNNSFNQPTPSPPVSSSNGANALTGVPVGYNTPGTRQAAGLTNPGSFGGNNPIAAAQTQQDVMKTAATGQTQAATDQWKALQDKAAASATLNNNLVNSANGFHDAYGKSSYTGARWGSLPSSGLFVAPSKLGGSMGPEQLADRYSDNMATTLAPNVISGHITDASRSLVSRLKLARSLEPDAEKAMYGSITSTGQRLKNEQDFYNQIRQQNPDVLPSEAEGLWSSFNNHFPPYDYKDGTPAPQNNPRWKQYATPEALNAYRNSGDYVPASKAPQKQQPPYQLDFGSAEDLKNATATKNEGIAHVDANQAKAPPSDNDIAFTAKKYGMTPQQVKKFLGI